VIDIAKYLKYIYICNYANQISFEKKLLLLRQYKSIKMSIKKSSVSPDIT